MRVKHSHILEERKFQDKTIICYIEVASRFVEYYDGQPKHQTHRWMLPQHWAKFDSKLKGFLNNGELRAEGTFSLDESISVRVKNSKMPVDIIKQCVPNSNKWNNALGLEFFIEYREITETNDFIESHEYEPPFISNSSDNLSVPYTPSVKPYVSPSDKNVFESSNDTNFNELHNEEPYSPKPVLDCSPDKNSQSPSIPTYKPTQVTREAPNLDQEVYDVQIKQELTKIEENDSNDFKIKKTQRVKLKHKNVKAPENNSLDREKQKHKHIAEEKHKIRDTDKTKKAFKNSDEKYETESPDIDKGQNDEDNSSFEKSEKRKRNITDFDENIPHLRPRRSSRSPVKPMRFDGKETSDKSRSATKHVNLFGSDDDDDDNQNEDFDYNSHTKKPSKVKKIPPNTPKSAVFGSVKKKKKLEDKPDHKKGNNGIDKWLEKKSTSKFSENKPSTSTSAAVAGKIQKRKASYSSPISYLSKEEIEEQMLIEKEQMEKNRMLKEVLEKVVGPPPAKVKTLSIDDLNENEVLDSFQDYKTKLDKVFQRNSKTPHSIKGHDGINHVFVIGLIDDKIQLKMLNKLCSEYEPVSEGSPAHLTLYANALMPEWILRLFMKKHKLTRDDAITHIKAQEAYNLHLKAQMENSMSLC